MGKGGENKLLVITKETDNTYSAAEISKHANYKKENDSWLVYNGKVYDISNFAAKHPGGWELITTYEGQDATAAMEAFHPNLEKVEKFLKPLQLGKCPEMQKIATTDPVMKDFRALTAKLRQEGYFEPNRWFYAAAYLHILAMEALAWYLVAYWKAHTWGWTGTVVLALILGLANMQGAWLQHDAGHKAIYGTEERWNWWSQQLTMGTLCGASTHWWKDRHSRHHAKTNIYQKDPDIAGRGIVLFGDVQFLYPNGNFILKPLIPIQTFTFIFAAVPSVATWLFVRPIIWHILKNGNFWDAVFMATFYLRQIALFYPHVGCLGLARMYIGMRIVQSIIFTWISQMSHIPRDIILDQAPTEDFNWVQMQCQGTLNIRGSYFNNWFSGHLNYQIEHHLWPTMPRHYYPKVAPWVQDLCHKHNIDYCVLPSLFQGCKDVVEKVHTVSCNFTDYTYRNKKPAEFSK